MFNIKAHLTEQVKKAYTKHFEVPMEDKINVHTCNKNADYKLVLPSILRMLQAAGVKTSTEDLTKKLCENIEPNWFLVENDNASILFTIKPELAEKLLSQTSAISLKSDDTLTLKKPLKVLVDFSSPNIAKDMHVGHLRSTIIGDSICNLFEHLGYDVDRVNHIGDFGLQFGMIIQHLLEKYPKYNEHSFSIKDLQSFYAQSKKRFDSEPEFQKEAYQRVVDLQSGNADIVNAWNYIKDISRQSYNEIYDRLDISLVECGESFYQDKIPAMVAELEAAGICIMEEGRKIIKVSGYEVPLTVVKSDGGFTYDTTDLCAVKYRLGLGKDKIIYVVDNGQAIHFQMIFKVAALMGWVKPDATDKLVHVGFGLVQGADGKKFKSRDGDTVKLKDLLDQAVAEARKAITDRNSDHIHDAQNNSLSDTDKNNIVKTVAYGSVKYADLASMRTNDYKFSFEKMLSLKGNTGTYQLYEYVRICAIMRNAGAYASKIGSGAFKITEKEEMAVCKVLLQLPEIIQKVSEDLMFHSLCTYLYDLSNAFSSFHTKCRCLYFDDKKTLIDANLSRLLICLHTKKVLEICFEILGIERLEKM